MSDVPNFSWNKLREQHAAPTASKEPTKKRMKRRRLSSNMLTMHNKNNSRTFTLNKELSKQAYDKGMLYLTFMHKDGHNYIVMSKEKVEGMNFGSIRYNTRSDKPTGTCSTFENIGLISQQYKLADGDYIFSYREMSAKDPNRNIVIKLEDIISSQPIEKKIEQAELFANIEQDTQTKVCRKCGKEKPLSEFYKKGKNRYQSYCKDCMKNHGKLRNGTTGEYRADPSISEATVQQLWEEIKRRGGRIVDGKLKIVIEESFE